MYILLFYMIPNDLDSLKVNTLIIKLPILPKIIPIQVYSHIPNFYFYHWRNTQDSNDVYIIFGRYRLSVQLLKILYKLFKNKLILTLKSCHLPTCFQVSCFCPFLDATVNNAKFTIRKTLIDFCKNLALWWTLVTVYKAVLESWNTMIISPNSAITNISPKHMACHAVTNEIWNYVNTCHMFPPVSKDTGHTRLQ